MNDRDLAGVQIPAGRVVIVLTPGEQDQPSVGVTLGQATVVSSKLTTGEDLPRLQFEQFQFHKTQQSPRIYEPLGQLLSRQ